MFEHSMKLYKLYNECHMHAWASYASNSCDISMCPAAPAASRRGVASATCIAPLWLSPSLKAMQPLFQTTVVVLDILGPCQHCIPPNPRHRATSQQERKEDTNKNIAVINRTSLVGAITGRLQRGRPSKGHEWAGRCSFQQRKRRPLSWRAGTERLLSRPRW